MVVFRKARIASIVKKVICEKLGVKAGKVARDSVLEDDLGADSLDVTEVIMGVEDVLAAAIGVDYKKVSMPEAYLPTVKSIIDSATRVIESRRLASIWFFREK